MTCNCKQSVSISGEDALLTCNYKQYEGISDEDALFRCLILFYEISRLVDSNWFVDLQMHA